MGGPSEDELVPIQLTTGEIGHILPLLRRDLRKRMKDYISPRGISRRTAYFALPENKGRRDKAWIVMLQLTQLIKILEGIDNDENGS